MRDALIATAFFLAGGLLGSLVTLAAMEWRHTCLPHNPEDCADV